MTEPANLPSVTTSEQDRLTASQRRVNIIWEATQAVIAVFVAGTGMITASVLALRIGAESVQSAAVAAFVFLTGVTNLVIGFYFGRTNHQRVGGIGGIDSKNTR